SARARKRAKVRCPVNTGSARPAKFGKDGAPPARNEQGKTVPPATLLGVSPAVFSLRRHRLARARSANGPVVAHAGLHRQRLLALERRLRVLLRHAQRVELRLDLAQLLEEHVGPLDQVLRRLALPRE